MRIPLGADLESRDGTVAKDARVVNGIIEVKGEGDFRVKRRPGFSDLGSVKSGTAQLLYSWNGINTIQGDYLNRGTISTIVSSPTQTNLSPTTAGLRWDAADTGSNAATPYLMIKNRTQAATVNQAGTVTAITYGGTMGLTVYNLVSITRSSTVATGTMSSLPSFNVGDSVTIAGANQTEYNGAQTITGVTPGTTSPSTDIPISSLTRSSTTATAVTSTAHGLTNGSSYAISGANQSAYNITAAVTVVDSVTFTYTVTTSAGATTTWNPSDAGATSIFSNGNLTVSVNPSSSRAAIRGTVGHSSGKWYWEVKIDSNSGGMNTVVGVANSSMPLTDYVGQDGNGWGYWSSGNKFHSDGGSGGTAYGATFTVGDVIGVALDMDSGTITFYKNGVSQSQAFSGLTGTLYPAISQGGTTTTTQFTADFGATTFVYSVPSGFSPLYTDDPISPASGTIVVTKPGVTSNSTFTYTVSGSPVTPATGTLTATTNGGTVPGIPYIDGYFCVMDVNGVIWNSNSDDPTTWDALSFIAAQSINGGGKALNHALNYLIAFKEWSTEYFYDTKSGTTGSPFAPVDNGFSEVGCASGESVARVDGNLAWLAQTREEGRSVYLMAGLQQQKISTPDIDRILNQDDLATVYAYGLKILGHPLYVLTLKTSNITLVYDLASQMWDQWTSLTIGNSVSVTSIVRSGTTATVTTDTAHGLSDGDPAKISGANQNEYNTIFQVRVTGTDTFTIEVSGNPTTPATGTILVYPYTSSYFKFTKYADYQGANLFLHETDGHLYQMVPTLYRDAGIPIEETMRTTRMDGGTLEFKKMGIVALVADSVPSNGVDNLAYVRWSDDDYTTNSVYQPVDLSSDRPMIIGAGLFRRRSMEVKYIGNAAPTFQALEMDIQGAQ